MKFIYFDIGNIFMTFDRIFQKVVSDFHLDLKLLDETYEPYDVDANLGNIKITDVWTELCQKLSIDNGKNYNFIESWVSDYESIVPMHEFVNEIKDKYPLGIISNYYQDFFEEATKQGFIPKVKFSPVIISADVGLVKPNLKIYELAQKQCGFSGTDILFIDDKKENLDAVKVLGWNTFQFDYKNPQESVEQLRKLVL